jgi:hypothetical protein
MTIRYRMLDSNGDYVFGRGPGEFLIDSPAAVAQAIRTRLLLQQGEWFLDTTEGTPYSTQIFGMGTQQLYDQAIQARILGTIGVSSIDSYSSQLNPDRSLSITCTVETIFGVVVPINATPQVPNPTTPFILDISKLDSGDLLQ